MIVEINLYSCALCLTVTARNVNERLADDATVIELPCAVCTGGTPHKAVAIRFTSAITAQFVTRV